MYRMCIIEAIIAKYSRSRKRFWKSRLDETGKRKATDLGRPKEFPSSTGAVPNSLIVRLESGVRLRRSDKHDSRAVCINQP